MVTQGAPRLYPRKQPPGYFLVCLNDCPHNVFPVGRGASLCVSSMAGGHTVAGSCPLTPYLRAWAAGVEIRTLC